MDVAEELSRGPPPPREPRGDNLETAGTIATLPRPPPTAGKGGETGQTGPRSGPGPRPPDAPPRPPPFRLSGQTAAPRAPVPRREDAAPDVEEPAAPPPRLPPDAAAEVPRGGHGPVGRFLLARHVRRVGSVRRQPGSAPPPQGPLGPPRGRPTPCSRAGQAAGEPARVRVPRHGRGPPVAPRPVRRQDGPRCLALGLALGHGRADPPAPDDPRPGVRVGEGDVCPEAEPRDPPVRAAAPTAETLKVHVVLCGQMGLGLEPRGRARLRVGHVEVVPRGPPPLARERGWVVAPGPSDDTAASMRRGGLP